MLDRNQVEIFEFGRKDFVELTELTRAYFTELARYDSTIAFADRWEPHYRQLMETAMGSPHFFVRGVRISGLVAGFIMFGWREEMMWLKKRRGYLANIFVIPSERRKGLGRLMVEGALQTLRQMDADVVELDVYNDNEPGRSFWKAIGFEPFKERLRIILE